MNRTVTKTRRDGGEAANATATPHCCGLDLQSIYSPDYFLAVSLE